MFVYPSLLHSLTCVYALHLHPSGEHSFLYTFSHQTDSCLHRPILITSFLPPLQRHQLLLSVLQFTIAWSKQLMMRWSTLRRMRCCSFFTVTAAALMIWCLHLYLIGLCCRRIRRTYLRTYLMIKVVSRSSTMMCSSHKDSKTAISIPLFQAKYWVVKKRSRSAASSHKRRGIIFSYGIPKWHCRPAKLITNSNSFYDHATPKSSASSVSWKKVGRSRLLSSQ